MHLRLQRSIFEALLLLPFILNGAGEKQPALSWPSSHLLPIKVSSQSISQDGFDLEIVNFNNQALSFYSPLINNWSIGGRLTFRPASISLLHSKNHAIKIGISLVSVDSWLKSIDSSSLSQYVDSLRLAHEERFSLLSPGPDFYPIRNSGYLLENPYRVIHYKVESIAEDQSATEIMDFVTQYEDHIFVFSVEAPEGLLGRQLDEVLTILFSFAPMSELS